MTRPRASIHAIVLDYGEVLCEPGDPATMAEMARGAAIDADRFRQIYWALREEYDRGTYDGPAYWRRVGEAAGVALTDGQIQTLIARDIAMWTQLNPQMMAWVARILGRGMRVGLLSNMVQEIGTHLRDRLDVFRGFTHVAYSCELHLVKPDLAIYHHALAGVGAAPGQTLFVDDRAVNVDAALALGMHAHLFRGHGALVADLDARYVLVS
jgi:putative hydrolase of the HAD superfamily